MFAHVCMCMFECIPFWMVAFLSFMHVEQFTNMSAVIPQPEAAIYFELRDHDFKTEFL